MKKSPLQEMGTTRGKKMFNDAQILNIAFGEIQIYFFLLILLIGFSK